MILFGTCLPLVKTTNTAPTSKIVEYTFWKMTLDLEELISESQLFLAILLLLHNSSIFVAKMNVISKRGEDISSAKDS